jgi:hypothetical protein
MQNGKPREIQLSRHTDKVAPKIAQLKAKNSVRRLE